MALNLMKDLFREMFARMRKPRISMDLDDIPLSQLVVMGQQFASNSIDKSTPTTDIPVAHRAFYIV